MRILGRSTACAILLLLSIPSLAKAFDRDYRERSKEAAYRAGYDDGYRAGLRHGEYDYRTRSGYHYHSREYDRADGYYEPQYRDRGHYKKGYRDGYREGYRDGYERRGFPRQPRGRFFY
jgi:flagellar biosynthesis/type III secretory pathway protein FliH